MSKIKKLNFIRIVAATLAGVLAIGSAGVVSASTPVITSAAPTAAEKS